MPGQEIIVIGGGAAGFFTAINCAIKDPENRVTILEKTGKVLGKVRVSGGGRCNVTHACFDNSILVKQYPRGEKALYSAFSRFSTSDTIAWFEKRGVKLKTEEDGRMFPVTDTSETIIECLLQEAEKNKVEIKMNACVKSISKNEKEFILSMEGGGEMRCNKLVVATGGHPKEEAYNWLREPGHKIEKPVPSLFTFNIPNDAITQLMGVSLPLAKVTVQGTKLESQGPLLITHWGLSGPAVLRLSAWGARTLNDLDYHFTTVVNWLPRFNEERLRIELNTLRETSASQNIFTSHPLNLPKRLWEHLLSKGNISSDIRWSELSKKNQNKLTSLLIADEYHVQGKTTFKEEFVTCGGISLKDVDFRTMESTKCKDLYFAGEVLDIDGITGGFNFQNAWTTGWIAATAISS